jgi:hypothetical protein
MDFATVKNDLRSVLGRDVSAMAFKLANAELSRRLRITEMEKTVVLTTSAGVLAYPDDFETVSVIKKDGVTVDPITSSATIPADSAVKFYSVEQAGIVVSPTPDDGDSYKLTYFAKVADLINGGDTNVPMLHAYEAFTYAVLYHHARIIRDYEASEAWGADATRTIKEANARSINGRMSGSMDHQGRTFE